MYSFVLPPALQIDSQVTVCYCVATMNIETTEKGYNLDAFKDAIYEILQTPNGAPQPDGKWHGGEVLRVLVQRSLPSLSKASLERMMENIKDPRFEVIPRRYGHYDLRLIREEPWPVKVQGNAAMAALTGLCRFRRHGREAVSIADIVKQSTYAHSTLYQGMLEHMFAGIVRRVGSQEFRLEISDDSPIWFIANKEETITSLAAEIEQEDARLSGDITVEPPMPVPQNVHHELELARLRPMLSGYRKAIARYQEAIVTAEARIAELERELRKKTGS